MSSLGSRFAPLRAALALAGLGLADAGCNVIDAISAKPIRIARMVPGANVATGGLDCWLTLEVREWPSEAAAGDLRVRFSGLALEEPAEFDWAFIAANDVVSAGSELGSGHVPATATRPDAPPPPGASIKIRFPLDAKSQLESAPEMLELEAELLLGGRRVDHEQRSIEHVYSRAGNAFF